ncbi:MAG: TonB-dependent receptor, partial [bacterium]|nr:TonB-dependent receptor [bacterium]
TFTASVYRNETTNTSDFFPVEFYDSFNPPPGWPLPPFIPTPAGPIPTVPPNAFPAVFTYRNIGEIVNEGIELSLQIRPSRSWRIDANYTYQQEPEVTGIPVEEVNVPPENVVNLGVSYDAARFYVNGNLNFVDDAYWADVLNIQGLTDAYTQVNVGLGWRLQGGKTTLAINGSNIFDEEVRQHLFGDIISRKISAEVRFGW